MAVQRARDHLRLLGRYGRVSVEQWAGPGLPYRDALVSLLVCEDPKLVSEAEIMRVCPGPPSLYASIGCQNHQSRPTQMGDANSLDGDSKMLGLDVEVFS